VGEWWATAVSAAGEQPPADLSEAVAEELIALWSDLDQAVRRAADRAWSVECDGLVVRIVMLSRLTEATPWQWIPTSLLDSGVYKGVLESAGIAFTPPCPTASVAAPTASPPAGREPGRRTGPDPQPGRPTTIALGRVYRPAGQLFGQLPDYLQL
jgi:hypothetical protein